MCLQSSLLVARKHIVEDSEDINTEYLPHLPSGLRSQCLSTGEFITDISHCSNTLIVGINSFTGLEDRIKLISY